ncbi:MAG: ATP-binding protein [Janthinobacterium lividum]
MPDSLALVSVNDEVSPEKLLQTLLAISLTGVMLLRPVYAADGMTIVDLAWVQLNPAAQRMLQLPERPTESFLTLFPTAQTAGVFGFYRDAFLSGQLSRRQNNYQHDGLDGYYLLVAQRQGGLLAVSFTDTNEHPRSAVEEELRQSQARELKARAEAEAQRADLVRTFAQAPVAIAILRGPAYAIEFANLQMGQLWGRPVGQLQGQPHFEALPDLAGQGLEDLFAEVYRSGETRHFRERPITIARAERRYEGYFNITYQPTYTASGQVSGLIAAAVDVTEQVLARRQLEQLNQELETRVEERTQQLEAARTETERQRGHLERLFMQAPAAICILGGPELVYELVNPGYQALFPGRELLGKPILLALPEIANNAVYTTFRQVYETGHTHEEQALLIPLTRPSDGVLEERYFQYIQQPRYAVDGRIDGVLVFAFEVTEQVRIRQQVQSLNEELAAINEELTATNEELHASNTQLTRTNVDLDTFVYTASHDLKAPITNIEGIVLALRDTLPADVRQDELVGHLLDLLNQTVTRFQVTINQLTDISRLQLAHTGPAEPVVLATVVEAVRLDLDPAITAAGTQLTVAVAPELVVSFSPANLRSIVYNLLSNAIKYRAFDRPSQVQLHAAQTPHGIRLTVQDNGLGMSEVQQRQLFGLFQRLHTHVEGTGVGLYITKRLVENAGGTIAVASQPQVGTTFTVTFPR